MKDDSLYSVDRFYFHPFLLLKPLLWSFFHAKVDLYVLFSIMWSFFNALMYLFIVMMMIYCFSILHEKINYPKYTFPTCYIFYDPLGLPSTESLC